jgi:osmotically inducible protein OsmC
MTTAKWCQSSERRDKRGKQMPDPVYSTKVTATGGRHGSIHREDGLLDLKLVLPVTLGGKGDATNPEQLFAGGYAACFENALFHVSREARRHFADDDIAVVAQAGLSPNASGAFVLSAALSVTIAGVDQKTAEQFVAPTPSVPTRMPSRAMSMSKSSSRFGELIRRQLS